MNIAQFIVGGFTLPLVAKFAVGHDRQHGWQMTMTIWAVLCLVLFLITFLTTQGTHPTPAQQKVSPKQDFADLLKNNPWKVMFVMTLVHFAILSFRGGALYNYYHHYADKAAMFDFVEKLGLTAPALSADAPKPGGLLEWLGYIVHGDRDNIASLKRRRRVQQHRQHGRHGHDHHRHHAFAAALAQIRQESRGRCRLRAGSHWHVCVLSAQSHQCQRHARADDS